jgi:hypothetical protein
MDEYIGREAALEAIRNLYPGIPFTKRLMQKWHEENRNFMQCETAIEKLPAADVVPVRHGQWIVSRTDYGWNSAEFPTHCKCSLCGREIPYQDQDNYCPNCGAEMDGEA